MELSDKGARLLRAYHNEYCSAVFPDNPDEALAELLARMDDFVQGYYDSAYPAKDRPVLSIKVKTVNGA
jgi:hypothetical protein